ncbi:MAG TPA: DUF1493 family protein [Rhizomicrobium sp.]|jgi:hypothetical protein|nr:DUF1493 family protein [Rhizomicrobium sp.]
MDSEKREKVVNHIREMSAYGGKIPITDDTEIYYDLRLHGDDLYELVVWLGKEFGVSTNVKLRDYGPGEGPLSFLFRKQRERRELEQRPYKSLKVRDILAVIETGRWPA